MEQAVLADRAAKERFRSFFPNSHGLPPVGDAAKGYEPVKTLCEHCRRLCGNGDFAWIMVRFAAGG